MRNQKQIGSQTPTRSLILPYNVTFGGRASNIYKKTGNTPYEWQSLLLKDILAYGADGLWTHSQFGISIPRQNGKNEVVAMRELYGLIDRGERIMHTAHLVSTAHMAWERLQFLVDRALAKRKKLEVESSYRARGSEHIHLSNGARIEFRTRTSTGGIGESYDTLIIDESQEYTDDQASALKYIIAASDNPQTIFTGTPPTPVSSGTVSKKFRGQVLSGQKEDSGWAEWGVDKLSNPEDRKLWYLTNPSLGIKLTERTIKTEIGPDEIDFNVQRLGHWLEYTQKSAISLSEWDNLKVSKLPRFTGKMHIGIKYEHSGDTVSMAVAATAPKGKTFVEVIGRKSVRDGMHWILDFALSAQNQIEKIVIDGANGQELLAEALKDEHIRNVVKPTVKQVVTANAAWEQAIYGETLCHMSQPALTQAVSNCEKRAIGSAGGFGYRAIDDNIDISLLDSAILAHWSLGYYGKKTTNSTKKIFS